MNTRKNKHFESEIWRKARAIKWIAIISDSKLDRIKSTLFKRFEKSENSMETLS